MAGVFRCSSLDKCQKAQMMVYYGIPPTIPPYLQNVLNIGTYIHEYLQSHFMALDLTKQVEIEYEWEDLKLRGHCDGRNQCPESLRGIIPDAMVNNCEPYIMEIKSISPSRFRYLTEPHDNYKTQLNAYLHRSGIHRGVFIYVNKGIPGMCSGLFHPEYLNDPNKYKVFPIDYDPIRWMKIERQVWPMIPYLETGELIPIQYNPDPKSECGDCWYKGRCAP